MSADLADTYRRERAATIDLLHQAATLMRTRAGAARPGPWVQTGKAAAFGAIVSHDTTTGPPDKDELAGYGGHVVAESLMRADLDHVMSWPPEMAAVVANTLDEVADHYDVWEDYAGPALVIARAYLADEPA